MNQVQEAYLEVPMPEFDPELENVVKKNESATIIVVDLSEDSYVRISL